MEGREIKFDFDHAIVWYEDGSYTVMCYAYKWEPNGDAYWLQEELGLERREYQKDTDFDSESGCFFAYTENPKSVIGLLEHMKEHIELNYTKEDIETFSTHPLVRLNYILE